MSNSDYRAIFAQITALANKRRAERPGELHGVIIEGLESGTDDDALEYQRLAEAAAVAKRESQVAGTDALLASKAAMTPDERREWFGDDDYC